MKKVNKKRIIILIILLIMIIIQIKAFTDSKADKVLEIETNIKDNKEIVKDEKIILEASNEGKSGYEITLPTEVKNKLIKNYIIEEKEVEENEQTNKKENILIKESEKNKIVKKKPGERLYLTSNEIKNGSIEIKVEYDTKKKGEKLLYNKILRILPNQKDEKGIVIENEEKVKNKNLEISLKGYMPDDAILKVEEVAKETIRKSTEEYINAETKFNIAYDIKIISEGKEYEPKDFDENVEVTFSNLDNHNENKKYKVLHINKKDKTEEIKEVEVKDNTIKFNAKEFSVYALLEQNQQAENTTQSNSAPSTTEQIGTMQVPSNEHISTYAIQTKEVVVNTSMPWDGKTIAEKFSFGKGTKQEPYLIADAEELAYLSKQVNAGNMYEGQYFQLGADIDIGNKNWTPIGNDTNQFRGILDGAGHTICNAEIIISTLTDSKYIPYGIFGSIGGGTARTVIKNIELSNIKINITASGETGSNSFFGVTQENEGLYIGTLVGTMNSNSSIQNTIVKNSSIQDTNIITITDSPFRLAVGGIVRLCTK